MVLDPRAGRFSDTGETSGVEAGMRSAAGGDTLTKKYIARNIKPYKSLKRFSTPKGLKGLKNKNFAQLERLAAIAVLKKNGVKRRKLRTTPDKNKYTGKQLGKAKAGISAGRAPRSFGNVKIRNAARHITQVRRNRRVMKTNIFSGKGYDIWKGLK